MASRAPAMAMTHRANSPVSMIERLWELLHSRTQTDPLWTNEELGLQLGKSVRTIERWKEILRDIGKLPPAK